MCTILSLAATHLSFLRPATPRYSNAALQLLTKSARLFRHNLTGSITPQNCDALVGTSILLQYLAWSNLDFLEVDSNDETDSRALDMSHDRLFLLSPGVQTLFVEAMPVLLSENSAFVAALVHRPRLRIEEAVQRRGGGAEALVAGFMRLWDDSRYIGGVGMVLPAPDDATSIEHHVATPTPHRIRRPPTAPREAFEHVVRGVALVLCVARLGDGSMLLQRDDVERYFFSFPVLASGPFLNLARGGDGRALVVLYHFYRAARVLLTSDESWWARERSRVLEGLILRELGRRGLGVCLMGLTS